VWRCGTAPARGRAAIKAQCMPGPDPACTVPQAGGLALPGATSFWSCAYSTRINPHPPLGQHSVLRKAPSRGDSDSRLAPDLSQRA